MSSAMTTQRATLIGLLAPLCWGMGVSLVRGIAEGFGLAQGQTLLYITLKTVESTLSQIRRRRARGTSGLWPSSP